MGLFKWHDKDNQKRIEHYLSVLAKETPDVANGVLTTEIKNVSHWMSDENGFAVGRVARAKCGCLIGATFMALIELHPDKNIGDSWASIDRGLLFGLHKVDGDFGGYTRQDLHDVGMAVYREVYDGVWTPDKYDSDAEWYEAVVEREKALAFKLKNTIRKNLGIPQLTKPE